MKEQGTFYAATDIRPVRSGISVEHAKVWLW
jgi:hypothetical protein